MLSNQDPIGPSSYVTGTAHSHANLNNVPKADQSLDDCRSPSAVGCLVVHNPAAEPVFSPDPVANAVAWAVINRARLCQQVFVEAWGVTQNRLLFFGPPAAILKSLLGLFDRIGVKGPLTERYHQLLESTSAIHERPDKTLAQNVRTKFRQEALDSTCSFRDGDKWRQG